MFISLSPTILDAGQFFRDRCQVSKNAIKSQEPFIDKKSKLSKLIHNRVSPDPVACLSRWYKHRWLSEEERAQQDAYLLRARLLIGFGFHLYQMLTDLSEKAEELNTAFNELIAEKQEIKQQCVREVFQAIYMHQQLIYALLDRGPEENQRYIPILEAMQKIGINLASNGLIQHVEALKQELFNIVPDEQYDTTSLLQHLASIPRTEAVLGGIMALLSAVGFALQIPFIISSLLGFLAVAVVLIRIIRTLILDQYHARNNDMLILWKVMGQYMDILNEFSSLFYLVKKDTTNILKDTKDLKDTTSRIEEKLNIMQEKMETYDSRPHIEYDQRQQHNHIHHHHHHNNNIINNQYNIAYNINVNMVERSLPSNDQQSSLPRGSAQSSTSNSPVIEEIEEFDTDISVLKSFFPSRTHRERQPSVESGYASRSPDSGSSSAFEDDNQALSVRRQASSVSKGKKVRVESPLSTVFQIQDADELYTSDSDSDSDSEIQRKAAKNAKIRALLEENAALKNQQAAIRAALVIA